jgi:nucleoside-diphosphate-sugar epimerase
VRVLHIGGTGLISSACVAHGIAAGQEVWVMNRGTTHKVPPAEGARRIIADASDPEAVRAALGGVHFDAVVQWTAFVPADVARDIDLYRDTDQYVFISSASAYQKPPDHYLVTESGTPLENPHWQYSRDKIACEAVLRRERERSGFLFTIVRPTLTYGPSQIPVCVGSWDKPFTIVDRMRRGAPIIVPGDGTSLWTITHNTDFAKGLTGLLGHPGAIGEDFHITSDEALTWNQIYTLVGRAAGAEPAILHVPTDALVAADPELEGSLWGDKVHSTLFDNTKLKLLVPDFTATTPFAVGIEQTIAWFDADPARQGIDTEANALWDRVVAVYQEALRKVAAAGS